MSVWFGVTFGQQHIFLEAHLQVHPVFFAAMSGSKLSHVGRSIFSNCTYLCKGPFPFVLCLRLWSNYLIMSVHAVHFFTHGLIFDVSNFGGKMRNIMFCIYFRGTFCGFFTFSFIDFFFLFSVISFHLLVSSSIRSSRCTTVVSVKLIDTIHSSEKMASFSNYFVYRIN